MNPLHKFFLDKDVYEAVKVFAEEHLKLLAVERSFKGEETIGIKEAKTIIDKMFNTIEETYSPKKEKKDINFSE